MTTEVLQLEARLASVEQAVADLQNRLGASPPSANWLDRVIGSITDQDAFAEVLELGKALRSATRDPHSSRHM